MSESALTPAELALERSGLEFLRGGKFRKARDVFKTLKKTQPAHALPLLIDANLGLARDMMSKGMESEAEQVLAYLKTIAPPSCNLSLDEVSNCDAWSAMVPLAAQRLASDIQPDAAIRAADEIILGAESPDHADHPDAKAILAALELGYGSAATEQTAPLLRSVPRASPFSHWVLFFKGMTALETGIHARAADCFRRVPKSSMLQASLPTLLTVCGESAEPHLSTRKVHALCAWAGEPTLAIPLSQAEPHWLANRRGKAFTLLTKQIPDLMCWGAHGFKADFTRLLTTEYLREDLDDYNYIEKMLDYVAVDSRKVARAVVHQSFFAIDFTNHSSCAHRHFETALRNLDEMVRVLPISPAMLSRIFTRLAESYIDSAKNDKHDLCSPPNAKKALEHAIKHDPAYLHAWLTQCDLLSMGKDTSAYYRFLDDLTKRFPTEKEVLIRNGDCCIARAVYTKALRNFEQAAQIDSVDPRIAEGILRAQLGIAEQAYKNGKPSKANWELIDSLASGHKAGSGFALWRLRVRRLVLELRYGQAPEKLITQAAAILPLAPSEFLLKTACSIGLSKDKKRLIQGMAEKFFPSNPAPQALTDFLAVLDEVEAVDEETAHKSAQTYAYFIFTEHENLLIGWLDKREHFITLLVKILSSRNPDLSLISFVAEKWYARDSSDPILSYLGIFYRFPGLSSLPKGSAYDIINDLRESKDPDIQRLLMLLERDRLRDPIYPSGYNKTTKLDLDYDPHSYDDDDYDDDDDESSFTEAFTAIEKATGKQDLAGLEAALQKIVDNDAMSDPKSPARSKPKDQKPPKPQTKTPPKKDAEQDPNQLTFDSLFTPPPNNS